MNNNLNNRQPRPWTNPKTITISNTNRQVHFRVPVVPPKPRSLQSNPISRTQSQSSRDTQVQQRLNQLFGFRPQPNRRPIGTTP